MSVKMNLENHIVPGDRRPIEPRGFYQQLGVGGSTTDRRTDGWTALRFSSTPPGSPASSHVSAWTSTQSRARRDPRHYSSSSDIGGGSRPGSLKLQEIDRN